MRAALRDAARRVEQAINRLSGARVEWSVFERRSDDGRWPSTDETDRRRLDAIVALSERRRPWPRSRIAQ